MTSTQRDRRTQRRIGHRNLISVLAALALVLVGAVAASPAHAAEGYTGTTGFPASDLDWDNAGGSRTIPLMYSGQPYLATIAGAQFGSEGTSWSWGVVSGALPDGLYLDNYEGENLTIYGAPEFEGSFSFQLNAAEIFGEGNWFFTFSGTVLQGKIGTGTTVTTVDLVSADSVTFSAIVSAFDSSTVDGGSVQFQLNGTNIGTPAEVSGNSASITTAVDASFAGAPVITAQYSGDDTYAASTGTKTVTLFAGDTVGGVVAINGVAQEGLTVTLTPVAATPGASATTATLADGTYSFTVPVTTVDDANRRYTITTTFDTDTTRSWNAAGNQVDADETGPLTWDGTPHNITLAVPPVWTDTEISTPRRGSWYTADIAAVGGTVTYSVTGGALPLDLALDASTGVISGTPNCAAPTPVDEGCAYSFTVTASNGYGSVTHVFVGSILRPGVPPTWAPTSPTEWALQETIEFTGGVEAEGDPDITYAVHGGELPSGITLDPATGAVTGTPACTTPIAPVDPCEYSVTIRATNTYGSVDRTFTGTIAAAPEIDLTLEFSAGTPLNLAESTISGSGLKVDSTYTLEMFSTPVLLYTGTIDATGGFSWRLGLPADTPVGPHRLLLTGIAPDGTVMTAEAWFTLLADGRIGGISYTGAVTMPGLASTGTDVTLPLTAALVLTMLGAALVGRSRFSTRH